MKKTTILFSLFSTLFFLTACAGQTSTPVVAMQTESASAATPTLDFRPSTPSPEPSTLNVQPATPEAIDAPLIEAPALYALTMLAETNGWGITESQVVRTNDGGVTWYNVTPDGFGEGGGYSAAVHYLDLNRAWIQIPDPNNYPNGGTLYRTTDGGIHWTSSATPFSGGDIDFIDETNGWMMADLGVGAGSMAISIFQTTNSGETWTRTYANDPNIDGAGESLPLGGLKNFILPLDMKTAWVGGVVYSQGEVYLFRTDNGGKMWFKIRLAISPEAQNSELLIEKIKFDSPTHGFLALRISSADLQTLIYETNDGGKTWEKTPAKISSVGKVEFISTQEIIFYSADQFYVTKDAAKTWSIIAPDVAFGDTLSSMTFANAQVGWALATNAEDRRQLYKTEDGGKTWATLIE